MFTIGPVGSAAWARAKSTIRVAGEKGTRGRLVRLANRVAEPTGFLYARIDCPRRLRPWGAPYIPARERSPHVVV
jgi:hypothetical protein